VILPRSFWKSGRVEKLITGHDGKTRGVVVKVPNRSGWTTTLRHPLKLLYPLKLKCKGKYEQPGDLLTTGPVTRLQAKEQETGHSDEQL